MSRLRKPGYLFSLVLCIQPRLRYTCLKCGTHVWNAVRMFEMRYICLRCGTHVIWNAVHMFEMRYTCLKCGSYVWNAVHMFEMRYTCLKCGTHVWEAVHMFEMRYTFLKSGTHVWNAVHMFEIFLVKVGNFIPINWWCRTIVLWWNQMYASCYYVGPINDLDTIKCVQYTERQLVLAYSLYLQTTYSLIHVVV